MTRNVLAIIAAAAIIPTAALAQKATPSPTPSATAKAAPDRKVTEMSLDEIFAKVDTNGNGRITKQELRIFGIQNQLGNLLNTRTWKRADKDRNGWLSRTEFTSYAPRKRR